MPRIVRHPELRRNALLDCAQALFLTRGYDNASLNDVIAEAGVSKGAFYHYFASKEALLEALADRLVRQVLAEGGDVLEDRSLDALSRLNTLMARTRRWKIENAATEWKLFETLFRPENLVLFHRINAVAFAVFAPIFTRIIREGVKEGSFESFDPEGVAEMLMQLGNATHRTLAQALGSGAASEMSKAIRTLERRIKLYEVTLDRLLGLPDGSIRLTEPGYVRAVMKARFAAVPTAPTKAATRRRRA